MKAKWFWFLTGLLGTALPAHADEGMWLLPQLKENEAAMQALGLELDAEDIYSPDSLALRDAVVIFDNGCTASLISPQGLLLTNHHCGYESIQQLSRVEHNYLEEGYWAGSFGEELPVEGLSVRFIDRIEEVTPLVEEALLNDTSSVPMKRLSPKFLKPLAESWARENGYGGKPGVTVEIKPFYAGNRYYLFVIRKYDDVRLVGTPPSSIGKFGGDTDNWMWPRHTGDFSLFRIYADAEGNPAAYGPENRPLRPKKYLSIADRELKENDFTMVIGFPGSTNRFYTSQEVRNRRDVGNRIRIDARGILLEKLAGEMRKDPATDIRYAAHYANLSNYWKNAVGMNRDIDRLQIVARREAEEEAFSEWARKNGKPAYADALYRINRLSKEIGPLQRRQLLLREALRNGMAFARIDYSVDRLVELLREKRKAEAAEELKQLDEARKAFDDGSFDWRVEQKTGAAMLAFYAENTDPEERPAFFRTVERKYRGDYARFLADAVRNSLFGNPKKWERFQKHPSAQALENDPLLRISGEIAASLHELHEKTAKREEQLADARRTYLQGLLARNAEGPSYPDANFTQRLTYGKVLSYDPKDGVHYDFRTTLKGVLEKEDSTDVEFVVPERLKTLYQEQDFGPYAATDGSMPVNFLSDNDITGGNSGSPVLNARGELIGAAFDGNWEAMSGDMLFEPKLQRCIAVDIRYILFLIDKFAGASRLIDEMTIVR